MSASIAKPQSKFSTVVRVTSGNFIEMYDFFLFGFYATYISKAFFPSDSEYASLMLTFATFGAGFLMRPLGAILLGGYIDRIGRRKGLVLTLGIMATGTAMVAFIPSYATIGLFAPLLVLVGRLLQGFSAGVELGGVSVYLSEMATPGHKGFYVSWQSASQQVAIIFSAALGYILNEFMSKEMVADWGWRIPFFIGCMIIPIVFQIRRSLQETEVFLAKKHHPSFKEILQSLVLNWQLVLAGMMLIVMTTVSFYLITVYTPTFGKSVLKLTIVDSLIVTFAVGISNFFWLPIMGALSDRIGRWPIMGLFSALTLITAYPILSWLVGSPSFEHMLAVELWLSFLYGSYNGATVVALTEIIPSNIRTTGFSLAYSLATALFGGFTPLVSTWLIESTGDKAAPGYWMAMAGGLGLLATFLIYRGIIKVKN
ncbi:MFS transporter [Polynucleobacter sphagniphilus]|jgi:MHS family citrate/tricarballylate:H+ symporter-like MFS transporter|uniref:MHS family citrate/tricarballylate:H+ symporter-like MFS transporter n=1 Tax=Polynucleobacter sphagniphilus TaxID=1743169 RepID=A0AA43M7X5_9BURK|nr:MFS transporter [Polynucleobacter sphagniphilus]MDF9788440.1 MHS family citrate/tricarballylate:H+ symporter-like MFS transporter [Polynucleobacter sphagniphilus]MDH6155019.1 MHS family citrate/tricarballylate:H+ symporter-like MFS transporter [Polynucleobacter sphagniphilus]MDH6241608.1 MHS family citrate/tricarballylate:H+ symporter-like MFS transporter [Polynucleobacter sphagniphilus]MDH6248960.1 MHS family citrate/tricarballylate:H+ symporter-like MFS transporter [Polynucleobacter sphagn